MTLSRWTPRRMALIWAAGIALQIVIVVAPTVIALRYIQRRGPTIRRQVAADNAHFTAAERADSISRTEQKAAARATGNFQVRADGQTVFAVVGMPSRRPVPGTTSILSMTVGVILGVQFGAIPLALIVLTTMWYLARRQDDDHHGVARLA